MNDAANNDSIQLDFYRQAAAAKYRNQCATDAGTVVKATTKTTRRRRRWGARRTRADSSSSSEDGDEESKGKEEECVGEDLLAYRAEAAARHASGAGKEEEERDDEEDSEEKGVCGPDQAVRELVGHVFVRASPSEALDQACERWFGFSGVWLVRHVRTRPIPSELETVLSKLREEVMEGCKGGKQEAVSAASHLVQRLLPPSREAAVSWRHVLSALAVARALRLQGLALSAVHQGLVRWLVAHFTSSCLLAPCALQDLHSLIFPAWRRIWSRITNFADSVE